MKAKTTKFFAEQQLYQTILSWLKETGLCYFNCTVKDKNYSNIITKQDVYQVNGAKVIINCINRLSENGEHFGFFYLKISAESTVIEAEILSHLEKIANPPQTY